MSALLDACYFLFRYIPFWAMPIVIICCQFAYVFWIKGSDRRICYLFMAGALFCTCFLVFYVYAGSPGNSVELFKSIIHKIP